MHFACPHEAKKKLNNVGLSVAIFNLNTFGNDLIKIAVTCSVSARESYLYL